MRQSQFDSNADSKVSRNTGRPAGALIAGVIALAIAAAAGYVQLDTRVSVLGDTGTAGGVNLANAPAVNVTGAATSNSAIDAARPHFERSDEPAVEDPVNAHGG